MCYISITVSLSVKHKCCCFSSCGSGWYATLLKVVAAEWTEGGKNEYVLCISMISSSFCNFILIPLNHRSQDRMKLQLKEYLSLVTYCDSALLKVTCHNVRKKLNKHRCHPPRLALSCLNSSRAMSQSWKFESNFEAVSVIQVVSVYSDLSSLDWAHATLHFLCREREKERWRGKKKLMDGDRQRQRDHMEFHSFRFLSQMLFSNWLMLFLLLLTVVNSWCVGGDSLDFWLLWAYVCTCVSVRVFLRTRTWAFCLGFSYLCPCVCVCTRECGCVKSECIPPLCLRAVQREKCVQEPNATHSGAMSNWNRLEPWRQGNSGCVCSPAVIFILHRASSGFFLLLFIHNEIDSFAENRITKWKNEHLSSASFSFGVFLLQILSFCNSATKSSSHLVLILFLAFEHT